MIRRRITIFATLLLTALAGLFIAMAPANASPTSAAAPAAHTIWCNYKVSGADGPSGLNFRSGPGLSYRILFSVPVGGTVSGTSDLRSADGYVWRYVTKNGSYGWMATKWLVYQPGTCL